MKYQNICNNKLLHNPLKKEKKIISKIHTFLKYTLIKNLKQSILIMK